MSISSRPLEIWLLLEISRGLFASGPLNSDKAHVIAGGNGTAKIVDGGDQFFDQ